MGGALLQRLDRDSLKYAMKACEITEGNVTRPVFKDPITDKGKQSKKGKQYVTKGHNTIVTTDKLRPNEPNLLKTIFKPKTLLEYNFIEFDSIRELAKV